MLELKLAKKCELPLVYVKSLDNAKLISFDFQKLGSPWQLDMRDGQLMGMSVLYWYLNLIKTRRNLSAKLCNDRRWRFWNNYFGQELEHKSTHKDYQLNSKKWNFKSEFIFSYLLVVLKFLVYLYFYFHEHIFNSSQQLCFLSFPYLLIVTLTFDLTLKIGFILSHHR